MIPHSRPTIEPDDLAAVERVLASGFLAQGAEVRAFEEEAAALLGLRGGVATSSGTSALHLTLLALGVGPGDEVLIPSYVCAALLHAVRLAGARARIVDSELGGVNMSPDDAARKRSPSTKAVIVPHMFGAAAPVAAFRSLGVPVIENCAQALGGTVDGRPLGGFGDVTVLSFYATKMITTGEGGMLLSRHEGLLDDARDLRDYDKRPDYRLRFNYKMTDMQAALGRSQLRKLPRFVARRRELARRYHEVLGPRTQVYTPPREGSACYRFVFRVADPGAFVREMAADGVECNPPVFHPLHAVAGPDPCPAAEDVFRHAASVPIYPTLRDAEADEVAALAVRFAQARREPAGATSADGLARRTCG